MLAPLVAGAVDQTVGPGAAYLAAIVPGIIATFVLSTLPRVEASEALQVV